jgi:hypothetical protein
LDKKEVVSFRKSIPANTTMAFTERVKGPGTIEGLNVKFYQGQQMSLHMNPSVVHKGEKRESLLTFAGSTDAFLSGDNDTFNYPCTISVDNDDYINISVTNTDATYAYNLSVDVIIDYYAGNNRVIGGVI